MGSWSAGSDLIANLYKQKLVVETTIVWLFVVRPGAKALQLGANAQVSMWKLQQKPEFKEKFPELSEDPQELQVCCSAFPLDCFSSKLHGI